MVLVSLFQYPSYLSHLSVNLEEANLNVNFKNKKFITFHGEA